MPRKTIRTKKNREALIEAAESSCTHKDAASSAGISERSLYAWIAEDAEFADDYACARAKGRTGLVSAITRAAIGTDDVPGDWRAAAWLLERMDPEHWAKAETSPKSLDEKLDAYLQGVADANRAEVPASNN